MIASTIITMPHSIEIKAVVEGVESQEKLNFMREHGCDSMQDYFLSKPLPAEQFESFLKCEARLAIG